MTRNELIEYIRSKLDTEELLCQLAEECSELAKAALKLRRAYNGENPTPIQPIDAEEELEEEIADVAVCLDALGFCPAFFCKSSLSVEKLDRWAGRLQERELRREEL